jgi:hypothetical protein
LETGDFRAPRLTIVPWPWLPELTTRECRAAMTIEYEHAGRWPLIRGFMKFPVPVPVGCRECGKRNRELAAGCHGRRRWGGDVESSLGVAPRRHWERGGSAIGKAVAAGDFRDDAGSAAARVVRGVCYDAIPARVRVLIDWPSSVSTCMNARSLNAPAFSAVSYPGGFR